MPKENDRIPPPPQKKGFLKRHEKSWPSRRLGWRKGVQGQRRGGEGRGDNGKEEGREERERKEQAEANIYNYSYSGERCAIRAAKGDEKLKGGPKAKRRRWSWSWKKNRIQEKGDEAGIRINGRYLRTTKYLLSSR